MDMYLNQIQVIHVNSVNAKMAMYCAKFFSVHIFPAQIPQNLKVSAVGIVHSFALQDKVFDMKETSGTILMTSVKRAHASILLFSVKRSPAHQWIVHIQLLLLGNVARHVNIVSSLGDCIEMDKTSHMLMIHAKCAFA